ncbi:SDR family oxidoreductase [Novipirellula artificiosorum]|uniref:dTDP-4-dehydrorhamnose reductase n=1 Tax=Novipirellula artificiosorum TaxID=2528016 RepID=A0A5C6DNU1_9BACT|nr:sugar nucleotide-binding protein [Novipirellula artificiosorum]TWU37331.1 dTDP-4-dehydrorhamnose reductase [Novipirellula artificiosorum]
MNLVETPTIASFDKKLPMLVTGIAGVPGYNAFHYFRERYGDQVFGMRQTKMWPLTGDGVIACDAEDREAVARLWSQYQFRTLLSFGGCCRLKSCEMDPALAHRVNVTGAENLIAEATRHDAQVLHLSVDLVFAGRDGGDYCEEDPPDPVTVYGAKMVEAERVVLERRPDACVLRISLPMGISFNAHAGAIDWIASRFKQDKPATLFFDEHRTPTYTDCMNELYAKLMEDPISGLYHAGGPRKLTLFQIGQIVNRVGGYDPHLLQGCPRIDAGPMPPRAGDVAMNSSKLQAAIGIDPFDPWPLSDRLIPESVDWHFDRSDDELGSEQLIHQLLYQNPGNPGLVPPNRDQLWGDRRFH